METLVKIFSLLLSLAIAANPGIRTSISQSAIESVKDIYIPRIISDIQANKIPDTLVKIGLFTVNVTEITFLNFTLKSEDTQIILSPLTNTLALALNNMTFLLTAKVSFRVPFHVKGTVNITLNSGSLHIPLLLGAWKGKIELEMLPFTGKLDSLDCRLKTDSTIVSFFQLFGHIWPLNLVSDEIFRYFAVHMGQTLNPTIDSILARIHYAEDLSHLPIGVDYHFYSLDVVQSNSKNDAIESQYIEGNINGTFYLSNSTVAEQVLPPVPFSNWATNETFRAQFSKHFFDSYLWALQESGILNLYIRSQDIPKSIPIILSTTGLSQILPSLPKVYGKNKPIDLDCVVYEPPQLNISKIVTTSLLSYCDFKVWTSSTVSQTAFRLEMQMQTEFTGYLTSNTTGLYLFATILPDFTKFTNFTAINSNIGSVNLLPVKQALNFFASTFTSYINQKIETQGIVLPLPDGIVLQDATIAANNGTIEIGATPDFSAFLID